MIAICDHNTAGNVAAAQAAAGDTISVLAGMEITTAEEVHVVGLFADAHAAGAASQQVLATLPEVGASRASRPQTMTDARPQVAGGRKRLLTGASTLDLAESVRLIHARNGLAIAAHVDRPSFSVISQLGLLPAEAGFDAVEISAAGVAAGRYAAVAALGLPVIAASDSHCLEEVGGARTWFRLADPRLSELALALRGSGGRRCDHA